MPTDRANDRSPSVALPTVPISVELAGAVRIPTRGAHRQRMTEEFETAIEASLDELGIPGVPIVELAPADPLQILRVLLNRRYYVPSRNLLIAAWQQTVSSDPGPGSSARAFADWLQRGLAEDFALWLAEDAHLGERVPSSARFLTAVIAALVSRHAFRLLGPDQAAHLLAQGLREGLVPSDQRSRSVARLEPARLAAILRPVLHAGISIRGRVRPLLKAVDEALTKELEDGAITEKLICRFSARPEIRISLTGSAYEKYPADSDAIIDRLREPALGRLGFAPDVAVVQGQEDGDDTARIFVNDQLHCAVRMIPPDTIYLNLPPDELPITDEHRIAVEDAYGWVAPDGQEGTVVPDRLQQALNDAGLAGRIPLEYAIDFAAQEIRRISGRTFTVDTAEARLAFLSEDEPNLALAVASTLTSDRLARIMRALLREQVSIGDFSAIIERIAAYDRVVVDEWESLIFDDRLPVHPRLAAIVGPAMREVELVRHIRLGLKREITNARGRGGKTLPALLLDTAAVKDRLLDHLAASYGASDATPLDAAALDRIRAAISAAVGDHGPGSPPILLTDGSVRPLVYDLMSDEFPDLAVLAYSELDSGIEIQPLGRIGLNEQLVDGAC